MRIKAKEAADMLNIVLGAAPDTVKAIIEARFPVSFEDIEGPCRDLDFVIGQRNGQDTLGPLGLMQMFIDGTIAAVYDDDHNLVRFEEWRKDQ